MHEIIVSNVHYNVDDLTMTGHLARPRGNGPWPTALVAHDGVGLDDYQRRRTNDLASRGYVAFAMDFHGGETFFGRPDAMLARTMPLLADPVRMWTIGRAALDCLLARPEVDAAQVVTLGYGAGGRLLIELAAKGADFKAMALVHPALPELDAHSRWAAAGPILLCTGSEDPISPPERLIAFSKVLQKSAADWRLLLLGGAEHAFWSRPKGADGLSTGGRDHCQATVPGVRFHAQHSKRYWRAVVDLFEEVYVDECTRI